MSKAALKELSAHLAQRHGLAREEAERFLTQFQDLIDEVLSREKLAKVKGLGTFKVQSVSARKSVDVNTGEAIEIAGREKVSYLPDTAMRDLVNRPFAAFETVVLNEEVDLSDLDEESPEVSQPDDMAPESFQSEDVIPEDTAESMEINTEGQFQTDCNNEQGGEDLISDTDLPQASSSTLTADTPLASTTEVSSATLQTPLPKLINNTNKMKMQCPSRKYRKNGRKRGFAQKTECSHPQTNCSTPKSPTLSASSMSLSSWLLYSYYCL